MLKRYVALGFILRQKTGRLDEYTAVALSFLHVVSPNLPCYFAIPQCNIPELN